MVFTASSLSRTEKLAWLRLIRSENVGPVTFTQLVELYGSASAALEELPRLAARGGRRRPLKAASKADALRELEACEKHGVQVIARPEADYPAWLRELADAPPLLFVKGHSHLWQKPVLGMVGARNASAAGRNLARQWATALGTHGVTVVSGLARGIDTAAHEGSLLAGTVAVVAGGVNHIYPPENRELHAQIAESGALVSENPLDMTPTAQHFPRRNRIISGMAQAVLVVEANLRSGSLITARLAGEQGREVLAVPGSPLDPRCGGTNQLLKDGAVLAASVDDILGCLRRDDAAQLGERQINGGMKPSATAMTASDIEPWRQPVIELLSATPTAVDDMLRQSGAPAAALHVILLELQLAGRLERHPGNRVALLF